MPSFTKLGYKKMKMPKELYQVFYMDINKLHFSLSLLNEEQLKKLFPLYQYKTVKKQCDQISTNTINKNLFSQFKASVKRMRICEKIVIFLLARINVLYIVQTCDSQSLLRGPLVQVFRQPLYKSICCASRSSKIFYVVHTTEKFGNQWFRQKWTNSI